LLDEPTTYLDLAHQLDVLELVRALNRKSARTVVMVLHDINQACRYADHLVAMSSGRVVAQGSPAEVITPALLRDVFDVHCRVLPDPDNGRPLVLPQHRCQGGATIPTRLGSHLPVLNAHSTSSPHKKDN